MDPMGLKSTFTFFFLWSISPANLQSSQNWKGHLLKVEHGTGNPHDTKIGRILLTHSKWPCFVWAHVWFQRGKRSVYHITWLWYSFSCALYKVQLRSNCSQIVPQAEIWVVLANLTVVVMFKQVEGMFTCICMKYVNIWLLVKTLAPSEPQNPIRIDNNRFWPTPICQY